MDPHDLTESEPQEAQQYWWQQRWAGTVLTLALVVALSLGVVALAGVFGFDRAEVAYNRETGEVKVQVGPVETDARAVLDALLDTSDTNFYRDWTLRQLRENHGLLTLEEMSLEKDNALDAILQPDSARRLNLEVLTHLVGRYRLFQADALSDTVEHTASFLAWIDRKFEEGAPPGESDSARAVRLQQVIDSDLFITKLRSRADSGRAPFQSIERVYEAHDLGPAGDQAPRGPCVWVNRENRLLNRVVTVYNQATERELVLLAVSGGFRPRTSPTVQLNQAQYEHLSGRPGGRALSVLVRADPSLSHVSDVTAGHGASPRVAVSQARNLCPR